MGTSTETLVIDLKQQGIWQRLINVKEMGFLNNANHLYTIDISCSLFSHLRRFNWFQIVFLPVFHPPSQKAWASDKGNMAKDNSRTEMGKELHLVEALLEASEAWDPGIEIPAFSELGRNWKGPSL